MHLENLFSMGGYGIYVWSAYAITAAVFIINVANAFLEKRSIKKIIQNFYES